jgi:hypothetical protein
MSLGGKHSSSLNGPSFRNRRCHARLKGASGGLCQNWALVGKTRCKLHGGLSTGPRPGHRLSTERIQKMVAGRRTWLAERKSRGLKAPGGNRKGWRERKSARDAELARRLALYGPDYCASDHFLLPAKQPFDRLLPAEQRRVLDEKIAKADGKRKIWPAKRDHFLAEQARAQREREAAEERERLAKTEAMRPRQDYVNWGRVQREAGQRYLLQRAYDNFLRCGGWGDLESGPMPRKQGVLDDPRMRRRATVEEFTAGIKTIE